MMMGTILRRRQDYERARQAFEAASRHSDRFPAIETEMALIDLENGRKPAESALGPLVTLRERGPIVGEHEPVDPAGTRATQKDIPGRRRCIISNALMKVSASWK